MIEAFVFDFDGLIVDTEWTEYVSIAEEFSRVGLDYPISHFQQFVGSAWPTGWVDELVGRADVAVDADAVRESRRARRDELLAAQPVLPGVVELLEVAAASGYALAVASSSSFAWVGPHLDRLGLRHHFAAVLTRDDVAQAKPAPDLYRAAAEALGVRAAASVAFEDSHNGCTAAKAAGLTCVVAPNRITEAQDFAHADLVVPSLAHVDVEALVALVTGRSGGPTMSR